MNRLGMIGVALLGACTVRGISGFETDSASGGTAGDDAEDIAPPATAETLGKRDSELPDGIPGDVCGEEGVNHLRNEYGYEGPCWDPPGYRVASLMPTAAIRGRRSVEPSSSDAGAQIWWFDMPEGRLDASSGCPSLQGAKEDFWHVYEPYEEGGLAPFVVDDLMGKPIAEVLDALDALDQPVCVTVKWETQCSGGHGKVCMQSRSAGDKIEENAGLQLIVGSDVRYAGTPDEERRYPEVANRKLDEVLADLKARGFTNVKVVEDKVQCERGIVCDADPGSGAQWVGTDEEIQLIVRRGKKSAG